MNVPSATPAKSARFPSSRIAALVFLIFGSIVVPTFSPAAAAPQDPTLATLPKLREAWVQDLRTKQLEPILKFYAPDAAFLQPNGERIAGSAALRTLFQNIMGAFNSDLTLHSQNLETSGDLAYDSGDFEESLTNIATGAKITSKGSYIIIFKTPAKRHLANRSACLDWCPAAGHIGPGTPRMGDAGEIKSPR